ncbi:hypothetical protein [Shinella sp. BYT-45]|uniref:hypothetical protein n=1 Tax=Shinella sp. BYT-45 TaxID=3377377 RepID=UPI0039817CE3
MIINLSPLYDGPPVEIVKSGDCLWINGEEFDFSDLPEGAEIADFVVPCDFIRGPITRQGGHVVLTIRLPYSGENPSAAVTHPAPIVDPPDGLVVLPADEPEAEEFIDPPQVEEVANDVEA